MVLTTASADGGLWNDIGVPLILAFSGAGIAILWPWAQAFQRGKKFTRIIRRELKEIGPEPNTPKTDKPWWEHAQRRFVHEDLFRWNSISQNRDFLLSLNPTVVYQVSQLWIALEKRDGHNWLKFLGELADNRKVRTAKLREAYSNWDAIIKAQPKEGKGWLEPMGIPSAFRQDAVLARASDLFEKRFDAYGRLLPLTEYGPKGNPKDLTLAEREDLSTSLRDWFYERGAGLLLSGRALEQFEKVRELLVKEAADKDDIRKAFTQLRTDLKIDLGVRQPQERDISMAWPEEERW
jgi:hypothetical protein